MCHLVDACFDAVQPTVRIRCVLIKALLYSRHDNSLKLCSRDSSRAVLVGLTEHAFETDMTFTRSHVRQGVFDGVKAFDGHYFAVVDRAVHTFNIAVQLLLLFDNCVCCLTYDAYIRL